jgi:hypothetical protein
MLFSQLAALVKSAKPLAFRTLGVFHQGKKSGQYALNTCHVIAKLITGI